MQTADHADHADCADWKNVFFSDLLIVFQSVLPWFAEGVFSGQKF